MRKYVPFLSKIKRDIDRAEIVSFDVFDTLLLRPYTDPKHLFVHVEEISNTPFFSRFRIDAEAKARRKNPDRQDITFDDIYNEMDDVYKSMKRAESDMEMRVLTRNPEMKQVWDYAKSEGKKIIIASDMYLPTDFIARALAKNGFADYDRIYVSGDLGKTKRRGAMYRHILDDLGVNPAKILHVGDNPRSDYKPAKKFGIKTAPYTRVVEQYLAANRRAKAFHKKTAGNFGASVMTSMMAWRWQKKALGLIASDYWTDLGYEYAGPAIYGYMRWVEKESKLRGIEQLLFVARDGWTPQKAFDSFNSGIKTNYVYAPRFLNLICKLDYLKESGGRASDQSMAIIDYYKDINPEIAARYGEYDPAAPKHKFITDNLDLFRPLADAAFANYKDYLDKIIARDAKIGAVDSTAFSFSAQKLIYRTGDNKDMHSFYWIAMEGLNMAPRTAYSMFTGELGYGRTSLMPVWKTRFIEILMASPEYPVQNVTADGRPVYKRDVSEYEKIQRANCSKISDGAVLFANNVKEIFDDIDIFLRPKELVENINSFIDRPTGRDFVEMLSMRFARDPGHLNYAPLFSCRIPLRDAVRHPIMSLNMVKTAIWRSWPQTIAVCVIRPIKISARGLKRVSLHLFPKLITQYLTARIKIADDWQYRITVGNPDPDEFV